MESAEQERTLRRIRRIRLVLLVGLLAASVAFFASQRRDAEGAIAIVFLDGATDQGHPFVMMLRDGRPAYFKTRLDAPCEGTPWWTGWSERAGRSTPFRFEDGILTVDSVWPAAGFTDGRTGEHRTRLRAEIDRDNRMRGRMRLDGVILRTDGSTYSCRSDWVTFAGRLGDR